MKTHFAKILLSLFFLGLFSSCNAQKVSVIEDNPCSPPCWYGIIPGESTFNEALDTLATHPNININKRKIEDLILHKELIDLRNAEEKYIELHINDDIVTDIFVYLDNWKLSKIFKLFGEPDYYLSYYEQYERIYRVVMLLYVEKGMIIDVNTTEGYYETGKKFSNTLDLNSPIYTVIFVPAEDFLDEWSVPIYGLTITQEFIKSNIHPWNGIGELQTAKLE